MTTTGESTRERLLDAARIAFAQKGFHGTTTRDIASAAGLSPAGVYVHHRSKEAMLYEISLAGHRAVADQVEQQAAQHPDPQQRLAAVVREIALSHATENDTARVVNYELAALSPEHRAEVDHERHRIQDALLRTIKDGIEQGVFSCEDPAMTSTAISAMAIDVARWYDPQRRWRPEDVAQHHAAMALRMVGAK